MYVLLVRWHGDADTEEWPAVTGPFVTEAAAEAEWQILLKSGECDEVTHEHAVIQLYRPAYR